MAKTERQSREAREFIRADDAWEPVGHTPLPGMLDLRNWDLRLLQTWKPLYVPVTDKCNLCTYGECDLADGKKGSCNMDAATMQARLTLLSCCEGLARSIAGARRLVSYVIDTKGSDLKLDLGDKIACFHDGPIIYHSYDLEIPPDHRYFYIIRNDCPDLPAFNKVHA